MPCPDSPSRKLAGRGTIDGPSPLPRSIWGRVSIPGRGCAGEQCREPLFLSVQATEMTSGICVFPSMPKPIGFPLQRFCLLHFLGFLRDRLVFSKVKETSEQINRLEGMRASTPAWNGITPQTAIHPLFHLVHLPAPCLLRILSWTGRINNCCVLNKAPSF